MQVAQTGSTWQHTANKPAASNVGSSELHGRGERVACQHASEIVCARLHYIMHFDAGCVAVTGHAAAGGWGCWLLSCCVAHVFAWPMHTFRPDHVYHDQHTASESVSWAYVRVVLLAMLMACPHANALVRAVILETCVQFHQGRCVSPARCRFWHCSCLLVVVFIPRAVACGQVYLCRMAMVG